MLVTREVQTQSRSAPPFVIFPRRVDSSTAVYVFPPTTAVSPLEAPGHLIVTPLVSV